jgi:hypothetical protein
VQYVVPKTHAQRVVALGQLQGVIKRSKKVVSDNSKFQGQIALAEIPMDTDPGEAQRLVHALAQEAGLPTDELAERRITVGGLPAKLRDQIMELPESYSFCKELVQHTEENERLAVWTQLKKQHKRTLVVNDIRAFVGKAPARRPSRKLMTAEEKRADFLEYSKDPDIAGDPNVARGLVENEPMRKGISAAYGVVGRNDRYDREERERDAAPGLVEADELNTAAVRLDQAEDKINEAIELLSRVAATNRNKAEILTTVDRIEQKLGFVRSWSEGGSFADAFEDMLREGGV